MLTEQVLFDCFPEFVNSMFSRSLIVGSTLQQVRFPWMYRRHISSGMFTEFMGISSEIVIAKFIRGLMSKWARNKKSIVELPLQRAYCVREEDKEIEAFFHQLCKNHPHRVNVIVLHGPGGYGKTCSAGNFVSKLYLSRFLSGSFRLQQQHQPNHEWSLAKAPIVKWTLDASSANNLLESYCGLAEALELYEEAKSARHQVSLLSRTPPGRQWQNEMEHYAKESGDKQALKPIYKAVMRKLDDFPGWVLIVDGVHSDSQNLVECWPKGGEPSKGLVVVTTQDPKLPAVLQGHGMNQFLKKVSIGRMKHKDATALLEQSSGVKITPAETKFAEDIAVEELECNPQNIAA